jgi:hypothetical protein
MNYDDLLKEVAEDETCQYVQYKEEPLPTGKYQATITNSLFYTAKEPPSIMLEFRITLGEHKDRKITSWWKFDKVSLGYFRKSMEAASKTMPLQADKMEDFLFSLHGLKCETFIRGRDVDGKMFYNVHINSVVSDAKMQEPEFDKDEQLPF